MNAARLCAAMLLAAFLLALGSPSAWGQASPRPELEGDWRGDIETPGQQIGVVFYLERDESGGLTATLDVPQQGARGISVSGVRATADSLHLDVAAINATFEGAVEDGGARIEGTWTQGGGAFPLVLTRGAAEAASEDPATGRAARRQPGEPEVSGRWQGRLGPPVGLQVVFNIEEAADGSLTATAESPDQSDEPFPVTAVSLRGDTLRLEIKSAGATFEGHVGADRIEGTFRQGGRATALTLKQGTADALRRPQEPEPPFPYEREDVRFDGGMGSSDGSVTLAGTLTLPQGEGPHPAVVLISGSGAQNRNEALAGHKPFLVLADYLTRRGIAVLRYDDRGVAESTGSFDAASMHAFASDSRAALAYLREREDLDLGRLGLLGHSEGGLIAPMVAAHHTGEVDFVVLLAGPGVPGREVLYEQGRLAVEAQGGTEQQAAQQRALQERLFAALTEAPDSTQAAERFRAILESEGMDSAEAQARAKARTRPAFRDFLTHDPRPVLEDLEVPILALFGEKDTQVTPGQNAPPVRQALADHPDATVKVLPGLNHLFQPAETGRASEYGQIETTLAPRALEVVAEWIAEHTQASGE